ncbi:hypothetical protein HCH52_05080 [Oscillospiraceae bacterium HV4-5-C5C]|nr:hypothetical protein [Oscillospiraceae bacterium HV4-5-C5C]
MISKDALKAMGLTDEQVTKVIDAQTEDMKGYVPRSRLDEVTTEKDGLKTQLADRDKDIKALQAAKGSA